MSEIQKLIQNLFGKWQLSDGDVAEVLGLTDEEYELFKAGELDKPELGGKLTELLRIDRALRVIFKEPQRGYKWIRKPNDIFGGKLLWRS
ncbi:hypothetical protein [Kiloniella litopenaei]|uniref:hypothetical protein n=1 Tax=Kiloniella litopenaei TaxID=1549748 RepID=UPI0006969D69|nr:hypothetical protein [Kiloniella litopenaei]